jgi:hypothetical protein
MQQRSGSRSCAKSTVAPEGTSETGRRDVACFNIPLRLQPGATFAADRTLLSHATFNIGEGLDLLFHRFRQVIVFGSHEAAKADAIMILKSLAKCSGILAQGMNRVRGFIQELLQHGGRVLPIAPG